jgi:hypothetical protein
MAFGRLAGGARDGEDILLDRGILDHRILRQLEVGNDIGDIEGARLEPTHAAAAAARQLAMGVHRQLVASCAGRTGHYHRRSVPRKVVIRWQAGVSVEISMARPSS